MNEDLEFIQNIIKEEIKTWTGYKKEIVDDVGEEEFIQEIKNEILECICDLGKPNTKEVVLEVSNDLMADRSFPF